MQFFKIIFCLILGCLSIPLTVQARGTEEFTIKIAESRLGNILTDSKGMTLYIFTRDKKGESSCYDQCANAWPPLLIENGQQPKGDPKVEGKFGVAVRRDGKKQVTYNDMPLYYYTKDKKPGDTYGQNVEGIWFVVKPNSSNHKY